MTHEAVGFVVFIGLVCACALVDFLLTAQGVWTVFGLAAIVVLVIVIWRDNV